MGDPFENYSAGLESPASHATALPDATTTVLAATSRGIYVGGAGDVVVTMAGGGADVTFVGVPAGQTLPVRVTAVKATSTATSLVALH